MTTWPRSCVQPRWTLVLLLLPIARSAQSGSLHITVADAATSAPLIGAIVEVRDATGGEDAGGSNRSQEMNKGPGHRAACQEYGNREPERGAAG
ncbi:MAG: hypothetical protein SGJ01_17170 [Gemmatimonadota bacterium]|nr:hypothetical protein [Gemmatimonadota bacterium]